MAEQTYTYTNESFSGTDIVATILMPNVKTGGNIIYTVGELQTISYSIHQDRYPVRSIGNINAKDYVMGPRTIAGSLVFAVFNKHFANKIMKDLSSAVDPGYSFLMDELPPFDIVLTFANEYGLRSKQTIYGVRLINEGQVMSINDVYTENTYQFVATDLEYLNSENSYSSYTSGADTIYKIVDDSVTVYNTSSVYDLKAVPSTLKDIMLNYEIKSKATDTSKGRVNFWLTPSQTTGYIKIQSDEYFVEIDVENDMQDNSVTVPLYTGDYTAYWSSIENKSNIINFQLVKKSTTNDSDSSDDSDNKPAPIVEAVGDNFIKICSNVKNHVKAIYRNQDGETFSLVLSGKRATITGLNSNEVYKIATTNNDLTDTSNFVGVTTLSFGFDEFKSLLDYLHYNQKALKNSDFNIYTQIISDAEDIAFSNKKYTSVPGCLAKVYSNYEDELDGLKTEDFPNIIEYQNKVDKLNALIEATKEVIAIVSNLNNDSTYGYNYSVMVVKPPVLESSDFCTNNFIITDDIESLEFYRVYTNSIQYCKTIEKRNFTSDSNGNIICTFLGKAETNHYVYAINKYGFRSQNVSFYTLGNEDKSSALEKKDEEDSEVNYEISRIQSLYLYSLKDSLTSNEKKRLTMELAKTPTNKYVRIPKIEETTSISIKISLDENESLLDKNACKAVISLLDKTLYNDTKYKISAKNIMTFTAIEHGIKEDEIYSIWIEDENGTQISECITVQTCTDDSEKYTVDEYFIDKTIGGLEDGFTKDNIVSSTLQSILDSNSNDQSISKSDIFDKILIDIISQNGILSNMFDILYSFFKVFTEDTYTISEDFFDIFPSLSDDVLTINKDCMMHIINLNVDGVTETDVSIETSLGNNKFYYASQDSIYTIAYFVDDSLDNRSGFILSNNINKRYASYKIQVKVGV